MAESFIATLKTELVPRRRFPDREVARSAIFEYLEGFYSRRRLHSALSYQSPMSYEEATMEGAAVAYTLPVHETEVIPAEALVKLWFTWSSVIESLIVYTTAEEVVQW